MAAALGLSLCLTACSGGTSGGGGRRDQQSLPGGKIDTSLFLKIVDDNPDNVAAAKRMGMEGIVFNGAEELRKKLNLNQN